MENASLNRLQQGSQSLSRNVHITSLKKSCTQDIPFADPNVQLLAFYEWPKNPLISLVFWTSFLCVFLKKREVKILIKRQ